MNDDYKQEQLPNESVVDRTELDEHNKLDEHDNHLANTGIQNGLFDEIQALGENYNLITKPIVSSSENPVTSTEKVTDKVPYWSRFSFENLVKEGIVNPETGEIDEDKVRQLMYG